MGLLAGWHVTYDALPMVRNPLLASIIAAVLAAPAFALGEETPSEAPSVAAPSEGGSAATLDPSTPGAASMPAPLQLGRQLQPGEPGYKSPAVGAGWSFGATLLPAIFGGFATRAQAEATMWVGFGLIVAGQSLGPSAGYWYANERARFTLHRSLLTVAAFGAAVYPLYAYNGRFDSYNGGLAAGLTIVAAVAEACALALAAWDLSMLGETIERHNFRPLPRPKPPKSGTAQSRIWLSPLGLKGGGGIVLGGML
jgi:hypothetical protein